MPLNGIRAHLELASRLLAELHSRPSHAYLFAGPGGVGKALVADALAHALLCERSPGENFCCTPAECAMRTQVETVPARRTASEVEARCECCAGCVQTSLGVHPDFNRVARAPNRTDVLIEQVRELIVKLGAKPSRSGLRVAIIEDAETLNIPAQNALLKTLEEPPGHAIIFLVTASERALLDTVRSRTRVVRFAPLKPADIEAILARRTEDRTGRLGAIARLARGSASRAIALLEGGEPPLGDLVQALDGAGRIDFPAAQDLARRLFASREQAASNFELIARLFEEMLCYKLLGEEFSGFHSDVAVKLARIGNRLRTDAILRCLEEAVTSIGAVEAMANPRLRAEQWWMTARRATRGE